MASKTKVLTEAEIVKMPKSEYMNAAQLRFFRERLLDLQKQLRENAGATTEHLRELSFAPDPADRATLEEEHALERQALGQGLDDDQEARLHEVEIQLDQCWDLLRQRRARRDAGQDPDTAPVRPEGTVEGYLQ